MTLSEALNMILSLDVSSTVDSAYLQVIFVRENIAIKRSVRLPESSIQTRSPTELQMQTIVSFHWQMSSSGTSIISFYFFEKWITFTFFFTYQVHKVPGNNPRSWHRLAWTLSTNSMKICFEAYLQLPAVQQLLHVYLYFQFFTNMIMCIAPLQPRLATCALVKLIDKFCAMS